MKKIFTLFITVTLFWLYAHAQTNDLIKYLPASGGIIIDIDGGSLSQKVSRQDLAELKFFDSLFKKAKAGSKEKFVDPTESGISNHDHFYVIFDAKTDTKTGSVTVFGKVSDESKLGEALQQLHDKEITRKTSGQNKMMIGKNFLFGWNSSVFVVQAGMPSFKHYETDTKEERAQKQIHLALAEKKAIELLTPRGQNSFTNKDFEKFIQTKADIKIWMDSKSLPGDLVGPFAAFKLNNPFQADRKAIIVNFEKGKIVSNVHTYYDDSTLNAVKSIYSDKLNAELFKNLPAGKLLGLYALSFKPGGVKTFIESSGLFKELQKEDKKSGVDPMIFFDNLKGDVIMAAAFAEHVYENEGESKNPFSNLNIFFAATVKDEAIVNRLIDSLKMATAEKKQKKIDTLEDGSITKHSDFFGEMKPVMKVENGTFYVTISGSQPGQAAITSTNKYDELFKEYGQRPTLMMLDLKTMLSMIMGITSKIRHTEEPKEMFSALETFDKMVISGGKFENGAMITTQEVKFSDANENSLRQMLKMFDLLFSTISQIGKKPKVKEG